MMESVAKTTTTAPTTAESELPTVAHLVAERAHAMPERVAIRFEDSSSTYRLLDEQANKVCALLADLGVVAGDHIGVMLANGPAAVEVWIGIARFGAVEVPISTALRGDGLIYPLAKCRCRVLITSSTFIQQILAARDRLPLVEHILVVDTSTAELAGDTLSYPDLMRRASATPFISNVKAHDIAIVLFSSGTTGFPKGVVLPHSAGTTLARGVVDVMRYGHDDVLYNAFPLSHVNARFTTVYAAMLADSQAVLHRGFSASNFWTICRNEGVTAFNYMGVMPVLLLNQPDDGQGRVHSVTRAYGSGVVSKIADRFTSRFGIALVETYGSTELGMVTCATLDEGRPKSCGVVSRNYRVEIHDELGTALAPGISGEIVVRPGRPGVMFREYLDDPRATVEATRELWFHTGDRGYFDADGWLFFVDRLKDVIRRRGENISSWEVEHALTAHPAVAEACAVGVDSEINGQEVLAVIVAKGDAADPEALLRHCERHLPYFAVPRYVRFAAALPRTASSRVEKYKIRAEGLTPDTWDREQHGFKLAR